MAIPKKGSRKINVNGDAYLWRVKDNGDHKSVTVQKNDFGQILYFCLWGCDANFGEPITPNIISQLIIKALESGWNPDNKSNDVYKLKDSDKLFMDSCSRN